MEVAMALERDLHYLKGIPSYGVPHIRKLVIAGPVGSFLDGRNLATRFANIRSNFTNVKYLRLQLAFASDSLPGTTMGLAFLLAPPNLRLTMTQQEADTAAHSLAAIATLPELQEVSAYASDVSYRGFNTPHRRVVQCKRVVALAKRAIEIGVGRLGKSFVVFEVNEYGHKLPDST